MINYFKGILQGDTLSLILFVLSVNPLSLLLQKQEGYQIGKDKRETNISHLFFVDDLKLLASTIIKMMKLLDTVTEFTNDVGMTFGESKCAYQYIKRGKRKERGKTISVNGLNIKEVQEGDHYKYLGVEEPVGIDNTLNKEKIIKEYKYRARKIWSSELNSLNRTIAHNTFAVSIVTTTMGVMQWTKKEIQDLDISKRKYLIMKGSFHRASDVDRLYTSRKQGGKGLRNIEDAFECRMIQLAEHLEANAGGHEYLELVRQHEETRIVRLGKEFRERCKEQTESSNVKERKRKEHRDRWTGKVTHGYLQKRIEADQNIDTEKTNQWLNLRFTSHIEGYVSAIQEQEIETKETRKRREKNPEIKRNMNTKCRACNKFDDQSSILYAHAQLWHQPYI